MLYCNRTFSRTFVVDLLLDLLSVFGPIIFLHCWQIYQNEMSHFFENGSPTPHYIDTLPWYIVFHNIRNPERISDGTLTIDAVNYFYKTLHLRSLTWFWIPLWIKPKNKQFYLVCLFPKTQPRSPQTSKMKSFAVIVNG